MNFDFVDKIIFIILFEFNLILILFSYIKILHTLSQFKLRNLIKKYKIIHSSNLIGAYP